jgi:hypothetical protein
MQAATALAGDVAKALGEAIVVKDEASVTKE